MALTDFGRSEWKLIDSICVESPLQTILIKNCICVNELCNQYQYRHHKSIANVKLHTTEGFNIRINFSLRSYLLIKNVEEFGEKTQNFNFE